jgi:gas vesicle protein
MAEDEAYRYSEPAEDRNDFGGRVLWFAAGAAVGVAVALLYAPASGKDTRKYIGEKAQEGREALTTTGEHLVERGRDLYERGKDLYERGRKIADEAAEMFERGRQIIEKAAEAVQRQS